MSDKVTGWKIIKPDGECVEVDKLKNVYINCNIYPKTPKQVCYICHNTYEPYLLDNELWEKISLEFRNKYICPVCFKNEVVEFFISMYALKDNEENEVVE